MKVFKSKLFYTIVLIVFTLIMIAAIVLKFALPSGSSKSSSGNMPSGFTQGQNFDPDNLPEGFDPSNSGFKRPGSSSDSDLSSDSNTDSKKPSRPGSGSSSDSDRPSRPDRSSSDSDSDSDSKKPSGSFTPGDGNFDPSNLPDGFDASNLPSGDFDPSNIQNGDFDPSNFQNGNFDPSNFKNGNGSFPSRSSKSSGFASVINKIWIPVVIVCALVDAACIFMLIRLSKKTAPVQINIGEKKKDS